MLVFIIPWLLLILGNMADAQRPHPKSYKAGREAASTSRKGASSGFMGKPHLGGQQQAHELAAEHPEGVRGRRLGRGRRSGRALVAADVLAAAGVAGGGARRGGGRTPHPVLHRDARKLQQDRQLSYGHAAGVGRVFTGLVN